MGVLEAAGDLLAKLSRAEKAQLLQWAARDLGTWAFVRSHRDEFTQQIAANEAD